MGLMDTLGGILGTTNDPNSLNYVSTPGKANYSFGDVNSMIQASMNGEGSVKEQHAQNQREAMSPYVNEQLGNLTRQSADEYAARKAAGGISLDTAPQQQFRDQQTALMGALQARAAGTAPSAAELQMRQGLDQQMAAQQSLAAGARGISPALAQRLAAQGTAQAQGGYNQQAGILRAQEQAQAEQAFAQALAGARGQDMSLASQQANVGLQNRAQDDAAANAFYGQQLGIGQAGVSNALGLGQLQNQANIANLQAQSGILQGNQNANMNLLTGVAQGGADGVAALSGMLSDERAKENVKEGAKPVREFLDALQAVKYDYKKGLGGDRKDVVGIMAQDLEKSEEGRRMVSEHGGLKHVDPNRALFMALAASADLNKRLSAVEGRAA